MPCHLIGHPTPNNSFAAGAGGGVCQVVVMGPCTFLVTAAVTGGDANVSVVQKAKEVWAAKGIKVRSLA
jgi:hypothetical protein